MPDCICCSRPAVVAIADCVELDPRKSGAQYSYRSLGVLHYCKKHQRPSIVYCTDIARTYQDMKAWEKLARSKVYNPTGMEYRSKKELLKRRQK